MKQNNTFSLWGFVVSALVLVLFSVQNAREVRFDFFTWNTYISLSVLLIVAFLLGLIAGAIFSFRQSKQNNKQEQSGKKKLNEETGPKKATPDKWDDLEDIDINRDKKL
ncbi:MAG: LapA family protein [bacterium]